LDEIGLTFENCIYFGDGANDATGLARCGLGIAMKGAKEEAIASANRVSKWTNDEDAVAEELKLILKTDKKSKKSKMLCLDLDGTVYNSHHTVSNANAKMIAEASENGYEICFCTGRGPTMYVPTPRELGIKCDIYMVGYNGAVVYRLDEDGRIVKTFFRDNHE